MTPVRQKAEYVKAQKQIRSHHCHWTGCTKQVPPAMWGCKKHWFALPIGLRNKIWAAYEPGQEVDGTPSDRYLEAAREVQQWIREYYRKLLDRELAARGEPKLDTLP